MSAQGLLRGLGSVVRKAGQALDSLGTAVQGKYGYKEGGAPLAECSQQQSVHAILQARAAAMIHNFL